jgi:hypothetical protein
MDENKREFFKKKLIHLISLWKTSATCLGWLGRPVG